MYLKIPQFQFFDDPMYIKAGLKTLCVEMSVLLLSICIFLFLYDNLKWISFFNYFGHLWYIFLCVCTTFCEDVHPYGYIIFGIGSHIPILNFEFFCWSKKTKEILSH